MSKKSGGMSKKSVGMSKKAGDVKKNGERSKKNIPLFYLWIYVSRDMRDMLYLVGGSIVLYVFEVRFLLAKTTHFSETSRFGKDVSRPEN